MEPVKVANGNGHTAELVKVGNGNAAAPVKVKGANGSKNGNANTAQPVEAANGNTAETVKVKAANGIGNRHAAEPVEAGNGNGNGRAYEADVGSDKVIRTSRRLWSRKAKGDLKTSGKSNGNVDSEKESATDPGSLARSPPN